MAKNNNSRFMVLAFLPLFLIFSFIILVVGGVVGYFIGSSLSVPEYVKSGVVTLVFTTPPDSGSSGEVDMVKECTDVAKFFLGITYWNNIVCNAKSSKYFQGEIDCACKF